MKQLVHGGDWMSYRERFGRDALDFSANVSPLGLPEGVVQAIRDALPLADRYPDPLCRTLRAALSRAEGVPQERILCGNGAADLIFRLVWAVKPHKALVTAPTFAEYASALDTVECEVKRFFLDETNDFAPTDALVDAVDESIDMVFLCQPNNPTGQLAEPALVEALLRRCEAVGAVLAVDECFLDFLPEGEGLSAKHLLKNSKKLIILKAFTKLYGMAGVRLGYCLCSDTELLARMRAAGQPWAISGLAQAAGIAALDETEYVAKVRALIEAQRPVLADGLRALGLRVIEGRANYLLFRAPEALGEALRRKGAVLRSCGNYPGLDASWYRTAVRTENENRQLLALLAETLPEVAQ
jgi:threonine-phosphate decarboxylase